MPDAASKIKWKKNRGPKPAKPYPTFPLYAHPAGVWAKVIRGRTHYFGPWATPHDALDAYLHLRDHLHAGLPLPASLDGTTVGELVNRFLASRRSRVATGEMTQRHYNDYLREGKLAIEQLGRSRPASSLTPTDFAKLRAAISKDKNATTVHNRIVRIRSIFKWGHLSQILTTPVNYGDEFKLPTAAARRKALRQQGVKMFTAAEIRELLKSTKSHPNLHAMIWLGINCALGNTDCSELRHSHLTFGKAGSWINFPRPKTEIDRRSPLWPETFFAIKAALQEVARKRRKTKDVPDDLADRVFVTSHGYPYVRINEHGTTIDSIAMQFSRLIRDRGIHRPGLGFYALRHTFRTVADETLDFPAIDLIMGHSASDSHGAPFSVAMAARYRQKISDERLDRVSSHVRKWLDVGASLVGAQ